ncbi:MAG: WecB/TagA/CpsF family glycosyltransferase [Pigmentiphaga sp.]
MATPSQPASPVSLFGLDFRPVSFDAAVNELSQHINRRDRASIVSTPNVDHIVRLSKQPELLPIYQHADYLYADGMPVVWFSRFIKKPLPERVTGADLFVALCHQAVRHQWKVLIIGGTPGNETALTERFAQCYPGLNLTILAPSMQFDPAGPEADALIARVRNEQADLIFSCLGMPKQERLAARLVGEIGHGLILCVGAAMEFAIGLKKRAPRWIQQAGFEWLWRLLSDPAHLWKRYLVNDPYFLVLCWKAWRNPSRQD